MIARDKSGRRSSQADRRVKVERRVKIQEHRPERRKENRRTNLERRMVGDRRGRLRKDTTP